MRRLLTTSTGIGVFLAACWACLWLILCWAAEDI